MPTFLTAVFSFAAYCSGAVVVRRRRAARVAALVHPLELLLVWALLAAVIWVRPAGHRWLFFFGCAALAFMIGSVVAMVSAKGGRHAMAGTREFEESNRPAETGAWKRWLAFSRAIADYEFRLLLIGCYLVIVAPFAIAFRFRRAERAGDGSSVWIPRMDSPNLDAVRRPF